MQRRDQAVLAALVSGLLIGAGATYALAGSLSRTSTTTTTLPAVTSTTTKTVTNLINVTSSSASTSTVSTGESSSAISPAPCALSYRIPPSNVTTLANGTQITENAIPAFVMGTGSTMELCVEYTNDSPNPPYLLTPTFTAFEWASCYPTCNTPPARNFTTNASPVSILFSQGQSIVVEYTISAGENSTGFVGLWEGSYLECTPIPVAVGYPSSQVNASDFPGYGSSAIICPPSPVAVQIIGYTGGSLVYLTEENRG